MKLAVLYAILAGVATVANIVGQDLFVRFYEGGYAIPASILFGTGVGLFVKYILDKKYIFRFVAKNAAHDARVFMLYMAMGIVTTMIFWGVEFGFDHLFGSKAMRYSGGVLGLIIGYIIKYRLDRRYVFQN